ncbi:hypothetical protein B0H15DRAFT_858090 [Mycena belliarum]|uniref:SET domain-containing protein n=1 Tax=Mycena belliarum TaxID=1033014 RepID=A0AAD6TXK1_9AGAR|nr:hypothetical protein B0H15DRAFT_858090 [Mycena belliae]
MKRGFLTTSKAQAKLSKDTNLRVSTAAKPETIAVKKFLGVVENATVRPGGYETDSKERVMKERDALAPMGDLDEDAFLYTSQPSIGLKDTLQTYPDGWAECVLYPDAKALILATPGFPAALVRPSSRSYRVTSTPDKGLGLFSTRKISAGDLILSERPLTISPAWTITRMRFLRELTEQEKYLAVVYEWEKTLQPMFDRLCPENKSAFMALANSHQHDGSGPIVGRIRTNSFGLSCFQSGRFTAEEQRTMRKGVYSAVYNEISRLNHSCSPNVYGHFDIATFSYQIFAVRDISKDEELTVSYTGLYSDSKARQAELKSYGFQCTCPACRAPTESDMRRTISSSLATNNLGDGLFKLSLLEEEGLQSIREYSETLEFVMERYIGVGDAANAIIYAKKLVKCRHSANDAKRYTTAIGVQSHSLWPKKS